MRIPHLITTVLLPSLLVAGEPAPEVLNTEINRLVQLHGDGISVSYPFQRKVLLGHFFGTGSNDAVALFVIEGFHGGNYHGEYIAFFQGNDSEPVNGKKLHRFRLVSSMQIGGKMWRTFDWDTVKITPESLTIGGKQWKPGVDPGCCPTAPFTATFRLRGGAIVESD